MKKYILLMALVTVAFTSEAKYKRGGGQEFQIGLGGAVNSTWLLNKNQMDQGELLDYDFSLGGMVGVNAVYQVNDNVGIGTGVFYSMHNQNYIGSLGDVKFYDLKAKLSYIDIPVLFRLGGSEKGFYLEVGPQVGILMSAKEDFVSVVPNKSNYEGRNVKGLFNGFDFGSVLGFGGQFDVSDDMTMTAGLRLSYSFTDVTTRHTEEALQVMMEANAGSLTDLWAHMDTKQLYGTYKPTNRASGGVFISLMYKLRN